MQAASSQAGDELGACILAREEEPASQAHSASRAHSATPVQASVRPASGLKDDAGDAENDSEMDRYLADFS